MTKATTRNLKIALILICCLLLATVILQNTSPVEARFLWMSAETPVVLLLFLTSMGGFVLGILVTLLLMVGKDRSSPKD